MRLSCPISSGNTESYVSYMISLRSDFKENISTGSLFIGFWRISNFLSLVSLKIVDGNVFSSFPWSTSSSKLWRLPNYYGISCKRLPHKLSISRFCKYHSSFGTLLKKHKVRSSFFSVYKLSQSVIFSSFFFTAFNTACFSCYCYFTSLLYFYSSFFSSNLFFSINGYIYILNIDIV